MKVFISWSGERSKQVAELLNDWIQCVIQAVTPWMSSKDIDRGAIWFSEINDQLANTCIGIVCLTKQNKNKPWILFESGALAKGISSNRVCTFLIDLQPTDIENPLAQFNHTLPSRESVWDLVRTINVSLKDNALKESILEKVFDTYWGQFEEKFEVILKSTPDEEMKETRSENEILIEVLSSIRMIDKRMRRIENEDRHREIDSKRYLLKKERMPRHEAELKISELVEKDLPVELIVDIMAEAGVPESFSRREANILMEKMKKEN